MRELRTVTGALLTTIAIAALALVGPRLLQDEIDQRVSGLEARVTVLEQQVAELQGNGEATSTTAVATAPVQETTTTHQLRGTFKVYVEGGHRLSVGAACTGGESAFVKTDARMTVYNGNGQVIATTRFHTGTFAHETAVDKKGNTLYFTTCELPFVYPNLPDSSFYEIRVEGYQFSYTYSRQELAGMDWILRLDNY